MRRSWKIVRSPWTRVILMSGLGFLISMPLLTALSAQSLSPGDSQDQSNAPRCGLDFSKRALGPDTEYIYTIQCAENVRPNELAILTSPAQSAITSDEPIARSRGITFQSYDSSTGTIIFAISRDAGPDIRLRLVVPTASTEEKSAVYYIASGSLRKVSTCVEISPQLPEFCSKDTIFFPVAKPKTVTKCPNTIINNDLPAPKVDALDVNADAVTGTLTLPTGTHGDVQVCVGNKLLGNAGVVAGGKFSVSTALNKLSAGEKIAAQLRITSGDSAEDSFGPASPTVTVSGASCSKAAGSGTAPTLTINTNSSNTTATYSGKLPGKTSGSIRICVNDRPNSKTITVGPDGTFNGGTDSFAVKNGDLIRAQTVTGDPPTYGPLSNENKVGQVQQADSSAGTTVTLIGGWEQAGYSSLAQYGNPFVNVSIDGPGRNILTGWGRVRLLSAPQPSTQGIVTTITNPTGQITTKSFSQVGQAMDFVVGPELRIPHSYWAVIAGFGATTPLSSQNVTLTYVAPAPGTVECSTLVNRFSPASGYSPGLVAAPPGSATCLLGGFTDVAFANQDRSNFLLKYGGGFRTAYPFRCTGGTKAKPCSDAYGVLDLTFGQDEAVTGGILRSVVFKLDGMLPIPLGKASWVYVFGSAYMRLNRNENLSPLILQTATGVTIPSPTVIVLPLRQPNRDYYRLGVGVNLSQIFCQLSASGCPNKNTGTDTSSQSADDNKQSATP